jgi:tRNA(Ile)-lysidine synthase TilS/MesJ
MKKYHLTALVTAHHKDDLTENFLIRQIRGSRLRRQQVWRQFKHLERRTTRFISDSAFVRF